MSLEKELDEALHSSKFEVMEVFRKIYEEYCKLIYYFIHKSVKSKEDCEDLTNDVFLSFFNSVNQFDTSKSLKAYLFTCASNKVKDYFSKKKDDIQYEDDLLNKENKSEGLHAIYNGILDEFDIVINELESSVIIYHVLYDFTFKEIARGLNMSINTIKSAYKRGIKKLREYYEVRDKIYRENKL